MSSCDHHTCDVTLYDLTPKRRSFPSGKERVGLGAVRPLPSAEDGIARPRHRAPRKRHDGARVASSGRMSIARTWLMPALPSCSLEMRNIS